MDLEVEKIRIAGRLVLIKQVFGYSKKEGLHQIDKLIEELTL